MSYEPRREGMLDTAFRLSIILPGVAVALCGALVLLGQVLGYLQTGVWTPVSLIAALQYFFEFRPETAWIYAPRDWIGAWKILNIIPASLAAALVGLGIALQGASMDFDGPP